MADAKSTTNPSRRHVVAALASTAASAPLLPAQAGEAEDPILPLFREWVAARIEWLRLANLQGNENWDTPEIEAADEREEKALHAMLSMTPVSMGGIAVLANVLWVLDGPIFGRETKEFAEECEEPINKAVLAIWRAASGKDGFPERNSAGLTLS